MGDEGREGTAGNGEIFQALAHRVRRAVIRSLAEKGERSFTELMEDVGLDDSSVMAFHMKKLGPLVRRNERGYYELTDLGWKAYKVLRELELESIRDRAEEVLEEIKRKSKPAPKQRAPQERTEKYVSEGIPGMDALSLIGSIVSSVVETISEALGSVSPADILEGVLSKGRVLIDKSASPAPKVRLEVIGSDVTLSEATNHEIRVKGVARRETDAQIREGSEEVGIKVRGMNGDVSLPTRDVENLEIIVKGGDLTTQNLKLPSNVSVTVLGGDVNMDAAMEKLSNLNFTVKGGDALADILVKDVNHGASMNTSVLGGDAHITLRVPKNTKVVRGEIRAAGGDVGVDVDESLGGVGEGARTLVINAKVVGGDASITVLPNTSK